MKSSFSIFITLLITGIAVYDASAQTGNFGIGTSTPVSKLTVAGNAGATNAVVAGAAAPDSSAVLEARSTTKGFLMPRMTTAQRDAIVAPVVGLQVFNLDDQCVNIYDGNSWIATCGLKLTGTVPIPNTDGWTQKADLGGSARDRATGFSIGNKGYIGTGDDEGSLKNDFWEYDPAANSWTQKADFGGGARVNATGFSIGSKGYIGIGFDFGSLKNDFWEYDPAANSWTQKADFGGGIRESATGFSIGSKGYIGIGDGGSLKNDFWEYDPAANSWTQKADFGGGARTSATGFSIGSKGYVGTGTDGDDRNDFWEYDPAANSWTQKANFGGTARSVAVGFSISSKGYIGTGYANGTKKDFWEYDPAINTWTQKVDLGGTLRSFAIGFSIGSKGYIGTGNEGDNTLNDFWEYTQSTPGNVYTPLSPASAGSISNGAWTIFNGNVFNSSSGNVGIGTSSPAAKLDVTGSVNMAGTVAINDNMLLLRGGNDQNHYLSYNGTVDGPGLIGYGGGVLGTVSGNALYWNNADNVGIGTSAPTAKLSVNGDANNTTGAWGVFSDKRIKTVTENFTDGLNVIEKINPVTFMYNENAPFDNHDQQVGVVAQDLEKIAPYMVSQKNFAQYKDLRQVSNQAYTFLLINSVKQQQAEIEKQQSQIEKQQSQLEKQEAQIQLLISNIEALEKNKK